MLALHLNHNKNLMAKIIVLGAGMVGSAIAIDLANVHEVCVADRDSARLEAVQNKCSYLQTAVLDVQNRALLADKISEYDFVVSAVPGFLGFNTLKTIIEAGKNVADISFFPEDALSLNDLAKEKNVTAIVDCGVAPGLDNYILGYYDGIFDIKDFLCLVGGLPKVKKWPFCYKAPFSPVDVIEEYMRPARYVENNQVVVREPLTDSEMIYFERVGELEAFNTDGLRSILFTMPHIPNRKEKTLRFPGHIEYIKVLKEAGFFDENPLAIDENIAVSPLKFTSKILFKEWKLGENEEEFTVLRVVLKGKNRSGGDVEVEYNLYDEYQHESATSSMARTTGYTATASLHLIMSGLFKEKGVFPPELVGKHQHCFESILDYLSEKDISFSIKKTGI